LYAAPPLELEALVAAGNATLWRPFVDPTQPLAVKDDAEVLIPVVPGIQFWRNGLPLGLCPLAVAPEFEAALPPSHFFSPILLACATRGIHDLIATASERAKPVYPRIAKALKNSRWQRQGLYFSLRQDPTHEEWAALFRHFLESGFLLPPTPQQPAILPGVLSHGEESMLAQLLAE
jgi:hypothetical protein